MYYKNKEKFVSALILTVSLITSGILVANAQVSATNQGALVSAANPSNIVFPISELGNCTSKDNCREYCAVTANMTACLDYAQTHNLMGADEIAKARKMANLAQAGGPGGCKDKDSCAAYCESTTDHLDECLAFAEKNGLVSQNQLTEMLRIQTALKAGANMPGGCKNKAECKAYCSNTSNIEECVNFAEQSGMIQGEKLEEVKKVMSFIKNGEMPGGCTTKESCKTYCDDSAHVLECVGFAEKAGLISKENAEMAKKTGGKGPGNCNSKNSCETYCNQKENQQICFDFAKEHGLISEEELSKIEQGTARLRMGLSQFPGEVVSCLKDKLGANAVGQIESGKLVPNKELGNTIQGCFNDFKPQVQAKIQEGLKNATPEALNCLQTELGEEGYRKMQSGDIDNPEDGDKVKSCFERIRERAKEQLKQGAEQLSKIPSQARNCIKEKLGSDVFDSIESGDVDKLKNVSQNDIQSAIVSCVSQLKPAVPSGPTNGEGMGITNQEQIREMMKNSNGTPPSEDDIQNMIRQNTPKGMPAFPSKEPTQEQIQNMMKGAQQGMQP